MTPPGPRPLLRARVLCHTTVHCSPGSHLTLAHTTHTHIQHTHTHTRYTYSVSLKILVLDPPGSTVLQCCKLRGVPVMMAITGEGDGVWN